MHGAAPSAPSYVDCPRCSPSRPEGRADSCGTEDHRTHSFRPKISSDRVTWVAATSSEQPPGRAAQPPPAAAPGSARPRPPRSGAGRCRRTSAPAPRHGRRRPPGRRGTRPEPGAVLAEGHLVVGRDHLAFAMSRDDLALLLRVGRAVRLGVVDEVVHVPAQQLTFLVEAEQANPLAVRPDRPARPARDRLNPHVADRTGPSRRPLAASVGTPQSPPWPDGSPDSPRSWRPPPWPACPCSPVPTRAWDPTAVWPPRSRA